jgi:ribosomal protein S3AE
MAAKKQKQVKEMAVKTKSKKNIKKKFYDVSVPLTSVNVSLYAASEEELEGRKVKLDLTRSLRGKSLVLVFKIFLDGKELKGVPVEARLVQGYIRRVVRRGTDYIEDSFEVDTRDRKTRIKPFLITRNRVSRAVRNALRNEARKFLEGHIKTRTGEEIFEEILSNKLQKSMSAKLKKIYPLAMSEIRVFEVLGDLEKKNVVEKDSKK